MPWSQDDDDRDPRSSQIPPYFPGGDQPPPAYEYGNVGVQEGQRPPSMPPYFDSYGYAPSHVNVANSIHGQPQPQPQLPPAVAGLPQHPLPPAQPRGKPEVMAAKLASAARIQEKMDELESEGVAESSSMPEDSSKPAVGGAAAKKQATPKKRKKNPPNKAPAAKKASRYVSSRLYNMYLVWYRFPFKRDETMSHEDSHFVFIHMVSYLFDPC